MRSSRRRTTVTAAVAAAVLVPAAAAAAAPTPGSPGVGDRLFPTLGNGGYDVQHYDLGLRYDTSGGGQAVDGTARINARATQDLSRFDLDFAGGPVGSVLVNRLPARFVRDGDELVITPAKALRDGARFEVEVRSFSAVATIPSPEDPNSVALFLTPDGSAMAPQPDQAHRVYPSNDHPSDKATFAFNLDVPAGLTAVANGMLTGRETRGGRTVWHYLVRRPMATAVTQIAVGDYQVTWHGTVGGVRRRDVTPRRLTRALRPRFALSTDHLNWLSARLGPAPVDVYGSLGVDLPSGLALETSTLSIYDANMILADPRARLEPQLVHELSHEWFGNGVSPAEWSDAWLSEGHAYLYQVLYAADHGQLPEETGFETLEAFWDGVHAMSDGLRAQFGPVALPRGGDFGSLFSLNAYLGGALVLEAVRRHIGDEAFATFEHEWLRRHAGGSVSTEDFIALASEVAGEDLRPFLEPWVYGERTPPLPPRTQQALSRG